MLNTLHIENSPFNERQIKDLQTSIGNLSPDQSQWLSGYLAGRLARQKPSAVPARAEDNAGHTLTVIFATETGHSERIAEDIVESLLGLEVTAELHPMDDFRPAALRKLTHVAFIISTHGEGEPPEEALSFFEYIESERAPRLDHLNYRILALGDSSYQHFCEAGRRLEKGLRSLGATPFGERLECDVDFSRQAGTYKTEIMAYARESLVDENPVVPGSGATGHLSLVSNERRWTREKPFMAEVSQVQKITADSSKKDVYHIELSLEDSGLCYQPGDSLGVWAPNDPRLVSHLLGILQIDETAAVELGVEGLSISEALQEHLEITRLTSETVLDYARISGQGELESSFSRLSKDKQQSFVEERQLIDVVERYPATVGPQSLAEVLRPLTPRSYSIASGQGAVDDEVHLTVATLNSNADGTQRQGVASNHLNHRSGPGSHVRVFLEPNRRFRLPDDPQTPIIMIAAGTGIAPYRAFMQELETRTSKPDSWLIFGNPQLRSDFLYQREWLRWRQSGLLNRIDTAWSRDQVEKRYVQDIVLEQAPEFNDWLERGACIYVCGSLRMGQAVQDAIKDVLRSQRGINTDEAVQALTDLRRGGKIKKDLY